MSSDQTSVKDSRVEKKSIFPLGGFSNCLAALLLASAFSVSIYNVFLSSKQITGGTLEDGTPIKVLYLAHWQLESGVREAWDAIIADYQKIHPDVRIIQQGVTERVYTQWLRTQLIGGMGTDMLALGLTGTATTNTVLQYFEPLTEIVSQPNPYNKGTDLEGVPWRLTYVDGMRGSYRDDLVDYFGVPVVLHTVRVYYNKDIFREVLGHDRPPNTFDEMKEFIAKLREAYPDPKEFAPMLGSRYNTTMFRDKFSHAFSAPMKEVLDLNFDGKISPFEAHFGFRSGNSDFDSPHWIAYHKLLQELAEQFQPGFMGDTREDTISSFVNGRAAMLATGSWDAGVMAGAKGEIGVFDVPLPSVDNPEYGPYFLGPVTEAGAITGGMIGITRFSRYPEIAIDFLQFATSQKVHEKFVNLANWIPAIRGARPPEFMKGFEPIMEGHMGFRFHEQHAGSALRLKYDQLLWPFFTGHASYDDLVSEFRAEMTRRLGTGETVIEWEWNENIKGRRRMTLNNQLRLSVVQNQMVQAGENHDEQLTNRYLALIGQQIVDELGVFFDQHRMDGLPPVQ